MALTAAQDPMGLFFFNTSMIARMVFQLRVVTGTPNIPSIIPKKPMVFMWRRYCPRNGQADLCAARHEDAAPGLLAEGKAYQ
jgi:hypothetical protein